jgi:hypothetical protein
MAMGKTAHNIKGFIKSVKDRPSFEKTPQSFHQIGGPIGEVGNGAFSDLSFVSVRLP